MAPSDRLQPVCQQQEKRSNTGPGKGLLKPLKAYSRSKRRDLNSVQPCHMFVKLGNALVHVNQPSVDVTKL
ncbi:MAG: hypothetical protein FRX49_04235 [Trebouxia sp. A1-2]|nr:MAG: hypothetical protein FRX49_04235 [Trebouxia sp. A1-2]